MVVDQHLFDMEPTQIPAPAEAVPAAAGNPRLRVPVRDQIEMHMLSLDEMLEAEHSARMVWQAVCQLDLQAWLGEIKAVEGVAGRDHTDPRLLVSLWVFATLDAVGSARKIARLCKRDLPYNWLCGGVTINHSMLSAFCRWGGEKLDNLLTHIVAALMSEGLVEMKRVAQDGMRVRADAGQASFRRATTLQEHLADAREQLEALRKQADETPAELTKRERAAQKRAAEERMKKVEEALQECARLQQQREIRSEKSGKPAKEARASTTDPEARTMQFPDGGYRPGYNVQYATDTASGIIVGVDVTNSGSDAEQLPPMLDQLQQRYDRIPEEALVDGGFATKETVEQATQCGCTVYAPLKDEKKQLKEGKDPYAKKKGDTPALAAWRARMATAAAKAIYGLRCQTAEWVNAMARNRGFQQMPVRGQTRCRTIAILYAITHNLVHAVNLRAPAAAGAEG